MCYRDSNNKLKVNNRKSIKECRNSKIVTCGIYSVSEES